MAINSRVYHPKYEVYRCNTLNDEPNYRLYRVKIYCIFCNGSVFTVFNQPDWIDNALLMRESGDSCSTFTHDIYVSPMSHPEMYNDIDSYVSQSSAH